MSSESPQVPNHMYAYLCPLNVFKHSHVALLHIQNVPSSLALNRWELLKNCRQVKDPVTAKKKEKEL